MAYTCVLAPSRECDGCGECEKNRKSIEDLMRWNRYDEEYDNYRDIQLMRREELYDR